MLSIESGAPRQQAGVVMMITLIVLVAMTLAGLSLTRSVDTSGLIAGNLAFHESALQSVDPALEKAVDWMEGNANNVANPNGESVLYGLVPANGYTAWGDSAPGATQINPTVDPETGLQTQTWDQFWTTVLAANGRTVTLSGEDAAGNTVSYSIQRLCAAAGAVALSCSLPPNSAITGQSQSGGSSNLNFQNSAYYRITVRIDGPHNTVAYAQALASM